MATDLSAQLLAPPSIVCSADAPYPAAASEDEFLPSLDDVVEALKMGLKHG